MFGHYLIISCHFSVFKTLRLPTRQVRRGMAAAMNSRMAERSQGIAVDMTGRGEMVIESAPGAYSSKTEYSRKRSRG